MTKPVDLDALDALYAKPHDGTPDDSPTAPEVPWVRRYLNLCAIEKATRDAYHAMSAELRERRAREEAMAAELRALREVAEAARAFVPEQARVLLGFGKIHPLTRLDSRVSALVDAVAKVPR